MTRRSRMMLAAVALAVGCAGYGASGSGSSSPPASGTEIDASDGLTFTPARLTVPSGTTVRWVNTGRIEHTVTSGAGSRAEGSGAAFDGRLDGGAVFERMFTEVGEHPYFCRFHETMGMTGVVIVTPAPGAGEPDAR